MTQDLQAQEMLFFAGEPRLLALYEAIRDAVCAAFDQTLIRVQKTQISFSARYGFACVSRMRLGKRVNLPQGYIVLTLGLGYAPESPRVAAATRISPTRWTIHIPISDAEQIDGELMAWVKEAYAFAHRR